MCQPSGDFDRRAQLVQRQAESDIGQGLRHLLALHQPEIDRLRVLSGDRRRHLLPVLAGGERGLGGLGLVLGGGEDLLHLAALGHRELVLALVVSLFQLRLGDLDLGREIGRAEARQGKSAILGRAEQILVRIVEFGQLRAARLPDISRTGGRQRHDVGDPLLIAVAEE